MALNWGELKNLEYFSLGYCFAISQNTNICTAPFHSCSPLCSCQEGQRFTLLAFGGHRIVGPCTKKKKSIKIWIGTIPLSAFLNELGSTAWPDWEVQCAHPSHFLERSTQKTYWFRPMLFSVTQGCYLLAAETHSTFMSRINIWFFNRAQNFPDESKQYF